jgi:hypothetical protein
MSNLNYKEDGETSGNLAMAFLIVMEGNQEAVIET